MAKGKEGASWGEIWGQDGGPQASWRLAALFEGLPFKETAFLRSSSACPSSPTAATLAMGGLSPLALSDSSRGLPPVSMPLLGLIASPPQVKLHFGGGGRASGEASGEACQRPGSRLGPVS